MVATILGLWFIIGGAALGIAGKDLLEMAESDLAGYTMIVAFGPLAWTIILIAGIGYGLDKLAERWRQWRA
jgi:hypothetical protein